jgi:hypothetical protein
VAFAKIKYLNKECIQMRLKFFFISVLFLSFLCFQAYGIEVSVPNVMVDLGESVIVPINVDNATGIAVGDITLEYDTSIVAVKVAKPTSLSVPLSPVIETNIVGKITINMASANGLVGGNGALFEIEFEAKAQKGVSPLTLSQVELSNKNLDGIAVTTKDGSVTTKEAAATPINISIVDASGNVGEDISTSIQIDDLTGVAGGDIVLKYDPNILSIASKDDVESTDLLIGFLVVVNADTAGKINISMASSKGAKSGAGAIFQIKFKGVAGGESALAFESVSVFDEDTNDIVINKTDGKITVVAKSCTTPIIKDHEAGSKILALQATYNEANVHGYAYVDIWKGEFPVVAGQFLEYQVAMFSGNPAFNGSVDLNADDGTTLRDSGSKDQNNAGAHPATDISQYARDIWYHRIISLDALAGKKLVGATIATDSTEHKAGLFRVYIDNIQITDGKCALLTIYKDEEVVPITGTPTSNGTTFTGTAGTKDYSVSVVGETAVIPAGKLTLTWGSIKK